MPNYFRIILLVLAVVCLMIGAYRMKIKQHQSKLEISIRMFLLLCFFAVIYFTDKDLNDTDALLIEWVLLGITLMVIVVIDRRKIKQLKNKLRLVKRNQY